LRVRLARGWMNAEPFVHVICFVEVQLTLSSATGCGYSSIFTQGLRAMIILRLCQTPQIRMQPDRLWAETYNDAVGSLYQ